MLRSTTGGARDRPAAPGKTKSGNFGAPAAGAGAMRLRRARDDSASSKQRKDDCARGRPDARTRASRRARVRSEPIEQAARQLGLDRDAAVRRDVPAGSRPTRYSCAICARSASSCGSNSKVTVTVSSASRVSIAAIELRRGRRRSAPRRTARRDRAPASRARSPASSRSHLLKTSIDGTRSAPTSASTACTAAIWRSRSGARRVDDVQQQVRLGHFFERGAERRDERVRQPIDEPDRVGHQQLAAIRQLDAADERIERDEQRVRRDRVVAGQRD